ncbi:hypothetical protein AAVH_20234 [Aphelenchoides avenae]|nr:hypothetical protein AAVH_20234 [Aphelenchus avenae]
MFGVDVVETCAIETAVDPRPWIHRFIETFETAERGVEIVRTVSWLYKRYGDASPLSHGVEPMRQPRCTDAPTPHSHLVKEWVQDETDDGIPTNESTAASLFVFENATLAKKLGVFVWTIEQGNDEDQTVLHYSFLLKVDDM